MWAPSTSGQELQRSPLNAHTSAGIVAVAGPARCVGGGSAPRSARAPTEEQKRLRYFMQRDGAVLAMVLRIFLRVIAQSLQANSAGVARFAIRLNGPASAPMKKWQAVRPAVCGIFMR